MALPFNFILLLPLARVEPFARVLSNNKVLATGPDNFLPTDETSSHYPPLIYCVVVIPVGRVYTNIPGVAADTIVVGVVISS